METHSSLLLAGQDWSDGDVSRLVNDGVQPDFWEENKPITFQLLNSIIEACELTGKPLIKTLAPALTILKPCTLSIPNIGTINAERKRAKNVANPSNIVKWLEPQNLEYIGPYCEEAGIHRSNLTGSSEANKIHPINNGVVLELLQLKAQTQSTWNLFVTWLVSLGGESHRETEENLRQKINKIAKKRTELSRAKKHEAVKSLLNATYDGTTPSPAEEPLNLVRQEFQNLERVHRVLTRKFGKQESQLNSHTEDLHLVTSELSDLRKDADCLVRELERERQDKQRTKNALMNMRQKYAAMSSKVKRTVHWSPYNSQRRQRRREIQIDGLKIEKQNLTSTLKEVQTKVVKLVQKNTKLRKKLSYFKIKMNKLTEAKNLQGSEIVRFKSTIQSHEIEAQENVCAMELASKEHFSVPVIEEGRYTDAIRSTAIQLHSAGVGIRNVAKCIEIVAREIFNVSLGKLPSNSTLKQFVFEGNILGKLQVGEALLENMDTTLHCDGTTDKQQHYLGYQVSVDESRTLTLGMVETVQGDTDTQVTKLKEIMKDLESLLGEVTQEDNLSERMILSIKNLMTDQHVVNKKFKDEFEEMRCLALDKCEDRWHMWSEEDKKKASQVNQWFCLLHVLLGLDEATERALKEYETILNVPLGRQTATDIGNKKTDSSCSTEAIKGACALFSSLGHPAAGLPADFSAFINKKCLFKQFKHNRFNNLGQNAVAYMCHAEDIPEFLNFTHHDNQLVRAVKADVSDGNLMALVRAVALFHVHITGPFHRVVLRTDVASHILDMNPLVRCLQKAMETLSQEPEILLDMGLDLPLELAPLETTLPPKEQMRRMENIQLTLEAVSLMSTAGVVIFSRQLQHHLPGGAAEDTGTLRDESISVPKSNSIGESQFALLKHLRNFKPNATIAHMESTLLWAYNKTGEWLNLKSEAEKKELFQVARSQSVNFRELWSDRQKLVKAERMKVMRQKEETRVEKAKRAATKTQENLVQVLNDGGQCRSAEDVQTLVANSKTPADLTSALKAQLLFYKKITPAGLVDRAKFFYSQKQKKFSNDKLASNLSDIIKIYHESLQPSPSSSSVIPDLTLRQELIQQTRRKLLSNYDSEGKVTKAFAGKKNTQMPDLCGEKIRHRWKSEGRNRWYEGCVLGVSTPGVEPSFDTDITKLVDYTMYDVKYVDDETIYHICLEKDWFRGDLELITSENI